jgi:hypothetical protein
MVLIQWLLMILLLIRIETRLALHSSSSKVASIRCGIASFTSQGMSMSSGNVDKKSRRREGLGKPKGAMFPSYELQRHQLSGLPAKRPYLVLGIETSCDDTGVAIVGSDGVVLSNVVYSQYDIHERFGGVVPSLAMESHKLNIEK